MARARALPELGLCALTAILVLIACSSDSGDGDAPGGTNPNVRDGIPALPDPEPRFTPVLASPDSLARHARGAIVGNLNRVRMAARTVVSVGASLRVEGSEVLGGCRVRAIGAASDTTCTYTLEVCPRGTELSWTLAADGPCGPRQEVVRDWLRASGSTNADASRGSFETYAFGTTRAEESWEWEMDRARTLESWAFYRGSQGDGRLVGRLQWDRRNAAVLVGSFAWDDRHRWEAEFRPDGTRGVLSVQERADPGSAWIRREEIRWEPAHGTWTIYDARGEVLETRTW